MKAQLRSDGKRIRGIQPLSGGKKRTRLKCQRLFSRFQASREEKEDVITDGAD